MERYDTSSGNTIDNAAAWQASHRWVDSFVIQDGQSVTDADSGATYTIKSLRGQIYLKPITTSAALNLIGGGASSIPYDMEAAIPSKDLLKDLGVEFIINKKLAYISDVNKIYNKDHKYFKNLQYLIIDCLWYNFHPSHFNLETSLAVIKKFKPKKAILTNLSPVLDYKVLKKMLPKNTIPAHDGLTINL